MQKTESQHSHVQSQPAVRQGKGAALESPRGERIAQFEALANGSPQAAAQRQLAGSIQNSPRMVAQGAVLQAMFGGVLQAKTDVQENLNDATDDKTSNKKINTPTQGLKWFRFAKNDKVINSFANNITDQTPKGANPVAATVDLADSNEVSDTATIPDMSRSVHFRLGDNLQGISSGDRTGKWTWHHKLDKYNMELVDMYTHGGFYHYGGFSQWDMDDDDAATA
ncbi:MAG: HNH endonuclease [Gallionella sp.]|jgi:hypothetical protein|nr:HNH endonuclease [Gallionella sp.]MCK9352572.1 HNH endonuclease [Gallionella sp.]